VVACGFWFFALARARTGARSVSARSRNTRPPHTHTRPAPHRYGHRIWPMTDGAKVFMIFYMFLSSTVVLGIIGELAGMYLAKKEGEIDDQILHSTTHCFKADLHENGKISQSDFVLFKLQQLQRLEEDMLDRLGSRFNVRLASAHSKIFLNDSKSFFFLCPPSTNLPLPLPRHPIPPSPKPLLTRLPLPPPLWPRAAALFPARRRSWTTSRMVS